MADDSAPPKNQIMKVVHRHKGISAPAFTLIEIMVVIGIILVLATMTIGGLGWYKRRAAVGKTTVLRSSIGQALESYRLENGFLPQGNGDADSTAQVYIALYGDGELVYDSASNMVTIKTQPDGKADSGATIHLDTLNPEFTGARSNILSSAAGSYIIMDAWARPFKYESPGDMNPENDFDLWSLGPDGKGGPTGTSKERRDDITNYK